jgi:hypothetical protein
MIGAAWPGSSLIFLAVLACQSTIVLSLQLANRLYALHQAKSMTPFLWCVAHWMIFSRLMSVIRIRESMLPTTNVSNVSDLHDSSPLSNHALTGC